MKVWWQVTPMVTIYTGTCPYDPELELKNFQRKQAEYEAAWCRTGDRLTLHEALRHATAAGQPAPSWLVLMEPWRVPLTAAEVPFTAST